MVTDSEYLKKVFGIRYKLSTDDITKSKDQDKAKPKTK